MTEEMDTALANKIYTDSRGGYGVFYEDELMELLPDDGRTREKLNDALERLAEGGYIDVRYARGATYCLAGIKPYEPPSVEETADEATVGSVCYAYMGWRTYLCLAVCAFFGSALGSLLCGLIVHAL